MLRAISEVLDGDELESKSAGDCKVGGVSLMTAEGKMLGTAVGSVGFKMGRSEIA